MPIETTVKLKSLTVRERQLQAELKEIRKRDAEIKGEIHNITRSLAKVQEELDILRKNSQKINVTEHGLLRYLERVKGIDLKKVIDEILTDNVKSKIETLKDCNIPHNGAILVVKNNSVVTVFEP